MRESKLLSALAAALVVFMAAANAQSQWLLLKNSLQKDVNIVEETPTRMVLSHAVSHSLLILTASREPDSDVFAALEVKRDGNPYRIWVTTEKFWNKPDLAEDAGRKFFRESFSNALRRESLKQPAPLPVPAAAERITVAGSAEATRPLLETAGAQEPVVENLPAAPDAGASPASSEKANSSKASLYAQAKQYEEAGELEMAIALYENLLASGDYKDVRTKLLAARNQRAQNRLVAENEAQYESGITALKEKDWGRAIVAFEKILAVDPDFRDARKRLAQAKRELQREITGKVIADHYADGVAAMNRNDLTGAAAAFESVRTLNPNYRDAASLLAQVESAKQQQAKAAAAAALSAQLDSLHQAALSDQVKGEWAQAVATLEKIQALQADYRDVAGRLAQAREKLNATASSVAAAPTPAAGRSSSWYVAGVLMAAIGLPLLGLIMLSPSVRARYHVMRSDYAAAVTIYERVLARHPRQTKLYPVLANLYLLLNRHDEQAMKIYKMVLQLNVPTRNREQINSIVAQNFLNEGRTDSDAIEVLENKLKTERKRQNA
jgi:tetratricopeptide (TPR) repeat protein